MAKYSYQRPMSATRSQLALRNVVVSFFAFLLPTLLGFLMRRYFILRLGGELMGLNGVVGSIINFLNVTELGLGAAIAFALYKPLYERDRETVREIMSIQKYLYRWMARIILLGGCIVACFFPRIFGKVDLPLWYAYSTFAVMMLSTLLSYYFNYRQVVFASDQRSYVINIAVGIPRIVKSAGQILALNYLSNAYIWWLAIELLSAVATTLLIEYATRRHYPWLHKAATPVRKLFHRHRNIITRTKQIIYHRVSGVVLQQGSRLVVYAVASAYMVMMYDNYMMIFLGIQGVLSFVYSSTIGSIGNMMVAYEQGQEGMQGIERIFKQFLSLRVCLSVIVVALMYLFVPPLISLWVGQDKLFGETTFYLFLVFVFLSLVRQCDDFISASGMYQDVWAPIVETVLNLGLSVWLGQMYGVAGVLMGVSISLLVVVHGWKPYFLYHYRFGMPVRRYWGSMLLLLAVGAAGLWLVGILFAGGSPSGTLREFIVSVMWRGTLTILLITLLYAAFSRPFRQMLARMYRLLSLRFRKAA